ncbi:snRNA-activating of 50 kDa MW carboxy-terminal protein [Toxoplasma gondii VAND]|uniref:snRNA-activating of 50 kDa MW carboxy-terminal protein n=2 Tax=Toxoplasma gondii TaxID=5811 RepID=A0A3R8AXJ4_TOXGO|nr:snRNA-activating of 50 kDa MW carboxy-terminal protein [Toxoplasma gondii VAND]RQX75795.1 snRNA-activating of 50 kDa MW carboxy-terminal protein [Toxoplasma gondii CAST]
MDFDHASLRSSATDIDSESSPVSASNALLPPGSLSTSCFPASSLEASSLYTNCPPSTFDSLLPWKSPSSPTSQSSPSLPPASPPLPPSSSPFLPVSTFPASVVSTSTSPPPLSSPAPSLPVSCVSLPSAEVGSANSSTSSSAVSAGLQAGASGSQPSLLCDPSLPVGPPPPPSFLFDLQSFSPSARFFARLQHGGVSAAERDGADSPSLSCLPSRSKLAPSPGGAADEQEGDFPSLSGQERHALLTGGGTVEEEGDPLLSSFEELEEGVLFPLPFCPPPEFLWRTSSDTEDFWGEGDLEEDRFPSLFRGDPQVYRQLLHRHFEPRPASQRSSRAKGAGSRSADELLVPVELQDEYLAFSPEPFASTCLSPAVFRERADRISEAIEALVVPPPPQPLPLRFRKFISLAEKLQKKQTSAPTEVQEARSEPINEGRERRDAAVGATRHHSRSPDSTLTHSSSASPTSSSPSPSPSSVSSSSPSAFSSSSVSRSSDLSCLVSYFAFFFAAGVRVPSVEEAVAWSVARELRAWPETLEVSVRRSLAEALRHSRARRFNRFACRVAWPPLLPQLCPYSEGNLWVAFREAVALASFRNVQDLFRSRFSRQIDLHNFALNQHTLQQRAHQQRARRRAERGCTRAGERTATPAEEGPDYSLDTGNRPRDHSPVHSPRRDSSTSVPGSSSSSAVSSVTSSFSSVSGVLSPLPGSSSSSSVSFSSSSSSCSASAPSRLDERVDPRETVISVSFYHATRGTKLASFDLLASQTLLDLRRALLGCCEGEAEPGVPLFPASCFLIDGVLFPDTRCPGSETEYADLVADHLRETGKLATKERVFFRKKRLRHPRPENPEGRTGTGTEGRGEGREEGRDIVEDMEERRKKEEERRRRHRARVERRGRILERRLERVAGARGVVEEREVWIVAAPPAKCLDGVPRGRAPPRSASARRSDARGEENQFSAREDDRERLERWTGEDGGCTAGGVRRWSAGARDAPRTWLGGDGDSGAGACLPGGEGSERVSDSSEEEIEREEDVVIIPQHEAVLRDLVLPLRSPACFLHQGTCEHRVVFWNLRQFDPRRDCTYTAAYPVRTYKPAGKTVVCHACEQSLAVKGVVNSFLCALHNPTYLCSACYRLLFGDGQRSTTLSPRSKGGEGGTRVESNAQDALDREEEDEEEEEPFAVHFDLFDG